MSRIASLGIEFSSNIGNVRADWEKFAADVQSRPIQIRFGGNAGGPITPPGEASTLGGGTGLPYTGGSAPVMLPSSGPSGPAMAQQQQIAFRATPQTIVHSPVTPFVGGVFTNAAVARHSSIPSTSQILASAGLGVNDLHGPSLADIGALALQERIAGSSINAAENAARASAAARSGFFTGSPAAYAAGITSAAYGVGQLGRRVADENAQTYFMRASSNLDRASSVVSQSEGNPMGLYVGSALNSLTFSNVFQGWSQYDQAKLAQRDAAGAKVGDESNTQSRAIVRAMGRVRLTGYSANIASARESVSALDDSIAQMTPEARGQAGVGNLRSSTAQLAGESEAFAITQSRRDADTNYIAADAARSRGQNRAFESGMMVMQQDHANSMDEMDRATKLLPGGARRMAMSALGSSQFEQRQAEFATALRSNTYASAMTNAATGGALGAMAGFSYGGAVGRINASADAVIGNLDASQPGHAGRVASINGARAADLQQANIANSRRWIESKADMVSSGQRIGRDPFGSVLTGLQAGYDSDTEGMSSFSPERWARKARFFGSRAEAIQQRGDSLGDIHRGQQTRIRSLGRSLARDPYGAEGELIAGGALQDVTTSLRNGDREGARNAGREGVARLSLLKQNYSDAFRGEEYDLRNLSIQNPRDQEDPTAVMKELKTLADQILDAIKNL